eukprot:scaffold7346_cov245-Pinguiococcus_pyrenoidosus.AAC.12
MVRQVGRMTESRDVIRLDAVHLMQCGQLSNETAQVGEGSRVVRGGDHQHQLRHQEILKDRSPAAMGDADTAAVKVREQEVAVRPGEVARQAKLFPADGALPQGISKFVRPDGLPPAMLEEFAEGEKLASAALQLLPPANQRDCSAAGPMAIAAQNVNSPGQHEG